MLKPVERADRCPLQQGAPEALALVRRVHRQVRDPADSGRPIHPSGNVADHLTRFILRH